MLRIRKIVFFTIFWFVICIVISNAQNGILTTKPDDLLKVRNLQYEQAKRLLRMQQIQAEYTKLDAEQQNLSSQIDNWIKEQAKINNIDLTKNRFDFDSLKFVEIKPNE